MKAAPEILQSIPRQRSMLPLKWSTSFPFTIMFLQMCKLSLKSINTTIELKRQEDVTCDGSIKYVKLEFSDSFPFPPIFHFSTAYLQLGIDLTSTKPFKSYLFAEMFLKHIRTIFRHHIEQQKKPKLSKSH